MAYTLADHKRMWDKRVPYGYYPLTLKHMSTTGKFAMGAVAVLPNKMRDIVINGWLKIANGVPARSGDSMHDIERADKWVAQLVKPFINKSLPLDVNASSDDISQLAKRTAERFEHGILHHHWNKNRIQQQAAALNVDWDKQFAKQIKNGWEEAILARLCDAKWWKRHFNRTFSRHLEHLYRAHCNLVHKRQWLYTSDDAVLRRRQQKMRNAAIMQAVMLVNELGQEFQLSELVEKSNSNPAIRRAELMVRIAGFETIAQDLGHCGEFITLTCPSRFHRAHHISGSENEKYDGSTPRQANHYLNQVWGRIQAALKRENIAIYGFRVVEPHHDGCPHWHGLFFMEQQHKKRFRQIVARYGCREDCQELGLNYFQTDIQRKRKAREIQIAQYERGEKVQSLSSISGSLKLEADFWQQANWQVFQAINARVDFKAINWKKGTAAGYIAKYIAKNIDGKNNYGENIGDDFETDDATPIVETAERVDAWASLWGIRQFQQIGGAPVTVWRELRREFADNINDDSDIMRAARAADLGDWGKFTQIMGGVAAKRSERPVQLYKELPMNNGQVWCNRYGEPMDKAIRGVVDSVTGEIRLTRIHEWVLVLKGAIAPAWTGVNNSTNFPKSDIIVNNRKEIPHSYGRYDYFKTKVLEELSETHRTQMRTILSNANDILDEDYAPSSMIQRAKDDRDWAVAELAKIRIFKETGLLSNGNTIEEEAQARFNHHKQSQALIQQVQHENNQKEKIAEQIRKHKRYLQTLDELLPPVWTITHQARAEQRQQEQLRQQFRQPKARPRKFSVFKPHNTFDDCIKQTNQLLAQTNEKIHELINWDF